ncbi:MAG: hypothetical protein RIC55_22885 [Pirellulaceae bacterium]
MFDKPKESDWKTFRKLVPEWRERYLQEKNEQIVRLLTEEGKTPTEQFWTAKELMDDEAEGLRFCLDGHSRSTMDMFLLRMLVNDMIHDDDLKAFSETLQNGFRSWRNDNG